MESPYAALGGHVVGGSGNLAERAQLRYRLFKYHNETGCIIALIFVVFHCFLSIFM